MTLARDRILATIAAALEPLRFVHALWEGGSTAFGNRDELSDLDLHVDVDDDRVEDVFRAVDAALADLSPIELRWRLAEPTWHGHSQCFYRLQDAGPFLLIDLCVLRRSSTDRLDERERHGEPRILFDKRGAVRPRAIDEAELAERLHARRRDLEVRIPLLAPFVEKELRRGNRLAALEFYRSLVLAPVHELVRILHAPATHDFGLRYARRDLPAEVAARLERLAFVGPEDDLRAKVDEALRWFDELRAALGPAR